jgi:hypothetical protein
LQPNFTSNKNYLEYNIDIKNFIDNQNYSENIKKFLYLFFDADTFKNKFKPLLKNEENKQISFPVFEMILYCYKLCILFIDNNNNISFYNQVLSNNMSNILKNNYIPGIEPKQNLFKDSFELIPKFYTKHALIDYGAYICSCGYFYDIPPCGFPMEEMNCPFCGLRIGGTKHIHVNRPGHYKIFMNEEHEKIVNGKWHGWFKKYIAKCQCILFEDLKKKVEQEEKEEKKGIQKNNFDYYISTKKQIRNLNQIAYRLLNLLIYSEIYFGEILGFISQEELNEILPEKTSSFRMLKENWNLLKNEINNKGIEKIQIFLNIINQKLFNIIKKYNNFEEKEKRNLFEDEINKLCEETTNNKDNLIKEYLELNNKLLSIDLKSVKPIIQESNNPEFYEFEDYPFLEYFMISTIPNKNIFIKNLKNLPNYDEKYPVISNYINEEQIANLSLLKNIKNINPFINYMNNYYSYKITREEGKKKLIKDELKIINKDNNNIYDLFKKFQKSWKNISKEAIKYKCRPEMPPKVIKNEDTISFILNDDGELGNGMYIASAYQNFIDWQNQFLNGIINNIKNESPLYYLIEKINKPIISQEAQSNEIANLYFNNKTSPYSNLEDIINSFCSKDCFTKDGKINYSNYKQIKFNFDIIEEELGKIILPGKRIFSTEQKFVTYGFEGYRGDKSSVLQNFSDKYPQNELNEDEKKILIKLLNEQHDFNLFMFSLQILIFYLQKENENNDSAISEILKKINHKSIYNISEDVKEFFNNKKNKCFKINNLLYVYEYIEQFCYNQIEDNVDIEYKQEINEELKIKINDYFINEKEQKFLITKIILASAVRKFISRYLSGKRLDNDVKSDAQLFLFLPEKYELWPKDYPDKEEFDTEKFNLMNSLNVTVSQSVSFYHILGKDTILYQN